MNFSNNKLRYLLLSAFVVVFSFGCEIVDLDEITDPNNPSAGSVLNNASRGQIQNLVTGLEIRNRGTNDDRNDRTVLLGVFGREMYYFNTSDPNFTTAWLQIGATNAEDDHNFFVDGSLYESPYFAVRQANLLILVAQNTNSLNDQEKNAVTGFAKTIKGLQLLTPLNSQYQNGIRIDVPYDEPLNPGDVLPYNQALAEIRAILDDGASDLANAGSEFPFVLTGGFENANTPATMRQFNRAIAARAAVYAEDWQGVLDALNESFMDLNANDASAMNFGVYDTFDGGNDLTNPFFFQPDASENDLHVVHPSMLADSLTGDLRVDDKFQQRSSPASIPDLPGVEAEYQSSIIKSPTDNFPILRNEELILLYAEAQAQMGNPTEAVSAINTIRNTWNVGDYTGPTDLESLIDEILFQRRYSLWGEGHRWIDARRYDRLDEIPTDLDGGRVPMQIAQPQGEIDWENFIGDQ